VDMPLRAEWSHGDLAGVSVQHSLVDIPMSSFAQRLCHAGLPAVTHVAGFEIDDLELREDVAACPHNFPIPVEVTKVAKSVREVMLSISRRDTAWARSSVYRKSHQATSELCSCNIVDKLSIST